MSPALRNALFPAILLAFAFPAISSADDPATDSAADTDEQIDEGTGDPASSGDDPAPARPAAKANEGTREVAISIVTLNDGQTLRGQIVSQSKDQITLELLSGGRMDLNRSMIRSISEQQNVQVTSSGEVWFRDPNRTRYFYAPSAMMLRGGEGYFSQKELFFSALAYGITDNVTVLVGSIVPAWFLPSYGGSGLNLIGALKAGFSLSDNLHLAAGAETFAFPFLSSSAGLAAGFVFASATVGNPNAHLTVSAGKPFALMWGSYGNAALGDVLVVVAGEVRVGKNLALMTENWIMPYFAASRVYTLDAVGARVLGEQWAADLGLIFMPGVTGGIPMPWVDFTYNFGS